MTSHSVTMTFGLLIFWLMKIQVIVMISGTAPYDTDKYYSILQMCIMCIMYFHLLLDGKVHCHTLITSISDISRSHWVSILSHWPSISMEKAALSLSHIVPEIMFGGSLYTFSPWLLIKLTSFFIVLKYFESPLLTKS